MKTRPKHSTPGGRVATLAERGVERSFARGAVVVSEGDTTDALYIILAGRVKVFVSDREGHELVLARDGDAHPESSEKYKRMPVRTIAGEERAVVVAAARGPGDRMRFRHTMLIALAACAAAR